MTMKVNNDDDAVVDNDPIASSLPKPFRKLTTDQRRHYNRYGKELLKAKKLKDRDSIALTKLAVAVDEYNQLQDAIEAEGLHGGIVQTFKSGATNVSGYVSARSGVFKEIQRLSKSLGLSIRDRKEIDRIGDPQQGELFDDTLMMYGKTRDAG
jgi:P27 family predicted phage terminase small subunit